MNARDEVTKIFARTQGVRFNSTTATATEYFGSVTLVTISIDLGGRDRTAMTDLPDKIVMLEWAPLINHGTTGQ